MPRNVLLAALLALPVFGCGGEGPAPGVDHEETYRLEIKRDTLDFVQAWERDKAAAQPQLQALVENFAASDSMDTGDHAGTYAEILATARGINDNYEQATEQQMNELKELAEKLPGDPSTLPPQGEVDQQPST